MLATAIASVVMTSGSPDFLLDPRPFTARVTRSEREVAVDNGLIRRAWRTAPNLATVALDREGVSLLRAVGPEATVTLDGKTYAVGGLSGQPNRAFLSKTWLDGLVADPAAFQFIGVSEGPIQERFAWKRVRHAAPDAQWPPKGKELIFEFRAGVNGPQGIGVRVCVEIYDGLPLIGKRIEVGNQGTQPVTLDSYRTELLSLVEGESRVEHRGMPMQPPNVHVETDYAFGGDQAANANRWMVHWEEEPEYQTQVSYLLKTPCKLEVGPKVGPAQTIAPGGTFVSHRTWLLAFDSSEDERQGLTLRKMYRTLAPWVTENPLMLHLLSSDPDTVKRAVDQCKTVGFEMIILSFGSGFDMENNTAEYLAKWKDVTDYARANGVEIGAYSLLASRRISPDSDNAIHPETKTPEGQTFGTAPALASVWGQNYFDKLYAFFPRTGFSLLEHDGSYPGDFDAAPRPPLQKGYEDSQWVQWRIIANFYRWCRSNGVYLNVPDWYFLNGSNKTAMGYRETNWSLPRAQQVIHARQNIYDGTWRKTPTMGWMFVPLSQYHGGGAAATIEPLDENLPTYEAHIANCLGMGVQACYRGPRLYDTDRTRDAVKKWVDWFKKYRDILESDIVHLRRADARDWDGALHVAPHLPIRGMAVFYNPLEEPIERTIRLPLYYTGLNTTATIAIEDKKPKRVRLARDDSVTLTVKIPAQGMTWAVIRP